MEKKISIAIKMLTFSIALIVVGRLSKNSQEKENDTRDFTDKISYIETSDDGKETNVSDFRMGTSVSVTVYADSSEKVAGKTFDQIDRLDSAVITTDIDKLCANYTVGKPSAISKDLYELLEKSLLICAASNGALDITIEPLNSLWGMDKDYDEFKVPLDSDIEAAKQNVGFENIILEKLDKESDKKYGEITFNKAHMKLAIGAVGKGYALDKARIALDENGADAALVTVGGSILVYGRKPNAEAFTIGIRDPKKGENDIVGYLCFLEKVNLCISTSGDYEKRFVSDGKTYHHILDRATGYPAESELSSVTIVCTNGTVSDGLSTACFVLGMEKSMPLLEKFEAEAIFIDKHGNITITDGLKEYWREK